MKRLSFVIATAIALSACNSPQPAPQSTAEASVDCPPAPAPEVPKPMYDPLPDGVVLDLPFHVRSDRFYTTRGGDQRRVSTLELLDGDAGTVAREIGSALEASGFSTIAIPEKEDGVERLAFRKGGYGRINVSYQADPGDSPVNPAAVGVLKFDWPVDASPAAP